MKCKFQLNQQAQEPYAIFVAAQKTPELEAMARFLEETVPLVLYGYSSDGVEFVQPTQVVRIYAQRQKVYAQTETAIYTLREPLYQLEKKLEGYGFLRISNAELVNSRCICHLDISLTGTIGVYLTSEIKTFASRRYVPKIKSYFGL